MATLRCHATSSELLLPARSVLGRAPTCSIRLTETLASAEHARIAWTGAEWELRDLGSTNGTYVDAKKIAQGAAVILTIGTELGFGVTRGFTVTDVAPPTAMARDVDTRELRAAESGILALPADGAPELTLFRGKDASWILEDAQGRVRAAIDGELLRAGGRTFTLELPTVLEGTPLAVPGPALDTIELELRVSRNEEFVELTVHHFGRPIPIDRRDHHYVLLTLARIRAEDRESSIAERGWIDRAVLAKMLSMTSNALNVAIHRARHQLLTAGIDGAAGIVEVRGAERRLGTDRFRITAL